MSGDDRDELVDCRVLFYRHELRDFDIGDAVTGSVSLASVESGIGFGRSVKDRRTL